MRRDTTIAIRMAVSLMISLIVTETAQAASTPQRAEIVQGLITQADLAQIDRRRADDRAVAMIISYETRIKLANEQIAALDRKVGRAQALTARERRTRDVTQAELSQSRKALADLAAKLADKDEEWAAQRAGFLAQIAQQVAAATPEMLVALQRFADGDRIKANAILERLENLSIQARSAAMRLQNAAELRARADRLEVMAFNGEKQPEEVIATHREIVAWAPTDLSSWRRLVSFESVSGRSAAALADLDRAEPNFAAEPDRIQLCIMRVQVLDRANDLAAAFARHTQCLDAARSYAATERDTYPLRSAFGVVSRLKTYRGAERQAVRRQLYDENLAVVRAGSAAFGSPAVWHQKIGAALSRICGERPADERQPCLIEVLNEHLLGATTEEPNSLEIGQTLEAMLALPACATPPATQCQMLADRVRRTFEALNAFEPTVLRTIAEWQARIENHAAAIATYRMILARIEPIVADGPETYRVEWDVSQVYSALPWSLALSGDKPGAIQACDALLALERQAFEQSRPSATAMSSLAMAYTNAVGCKAEFGAGDARPALRQAVELRRRVVNAAPSDPLEIDLLIDSLANLGEAEFASDDAHLGARQFDEAIGKLRPLAFGPRDTGGWNATHLAALEARLANALAHAGETKRAEAAYRRAIAIHERLDRLPKPNDRLYRDLPDLLWNFADFLDDLDNPTATEAYRRSVEASRVIASRSGPRQVDARNAYADRLIDHGEYLEKRNDFAGAIAAYRLALDELQALLPMERSYVFPEEVAATYFRLGVVQAKAAKPDDANIAYRAGFDILVQDAVSARYLIRRRQKLNTAIARLRKIYLDKCDIVHAASLILATIPLRETHFERYPQDEDVRADLVSGLLEAGIFKRATGDSAGATAAFGRCVMLAGQSSLQGIARQAIDASREDCQARLAPVTH